MKVLNKKHSSALSKSVKSASLILLTSLLFACQGETSAESSAVSAADAVEKVTESVSSAATDAADKVSKTVEAAASVEAPSTPAVETPSTPKTPRKPADFSTLNANSYAPVSENIPVSTGQQIEVTELFWFGCGHCYQLEPHLKAWLRNKPEKAKFKKVPAIFSKSWEFHAKAFYTMEALKVPEKAYDEFFIQIHERNQRMNSLDALTSFLKDFGHDKAAVESAFNSFAVDSQIRNAAKISRASGARGVPALIVDGKYVTSQGQAGGTKQMFDTIDKLVEKAASER